MRTRCRRAIGPRTGRLVPHGEVGAAAALGLAWLALACGSAGPGWERSSPEQEGLEPVAFRRFVRAVAARDTDALVVLRNGRVVHEGYALGHGRGRPEHTASLVKGVVGGLALVLLAAEGRIDLDAPAVGRLPRWQADARRAAITPRQLATHSSGLAGAGAGEGPPAEGGGWKGRFWRHDPGQTPVDVALDEVPLAFPPGQGFAYSSPGFAVLSQVLAAALADSGEGTLPELLRDRVFRAIGVGDEEWRIGYGTPFDVDGLETWATWGGGKLSPGALARLGLLLLRRGDWYGHRVLPAAAVETLVRYGGTPLDEGGSWPAPALGWWSNARGTWPGLPRDAFLAFGAGHKLLLVVPSLDLVLVRLGGPLDPDAAADDFWGPLGELLLEPLMAAFPPPPVPRSEVLAGAWFDPPWSVACRAVGSDNWPITWTRDGSLFTSYGDGWGFEPHLDQKLSQGFARLDGDATDFRAENVRSPSGERLGDGASGAKASGLLAVDGVLYLWARNVANSQLAWSEDDGETWEWGFRFRESFGSPTFLNVGPDYAGARDGFVYVYSQDGPSAYESDDRLILARVPRQRIREREAYEFYAGRGVSGSPRWSHELHSREGTLEAVGACRRSEVVFDAGLGRYLMTLGFDFHGGWGIFEAAEPWGPWRTVYSTARWDLGDTGSYRLPARWIRDRGRSLAVVLSGTDRDDRILDGFCVRGLRILPVAAPRGLRALPVATP